MLSDDDLKSILEVEDDDVSLETAAAMARELLAIRERAAALQSFAESFATTAEAAVAHHESKGKGGQHVPFHDDFANVPPSTVSRLRWWAARAREALGPGAPAPKPAPGVADVVRVHEHHARLSGHERLYSEEEVEKAVMQERNARTDTLLVERALVGLENGVLRRLRGDGFGVPKCRKCPVDATMPCGLCSDHCIHMHIVEVKP